jgi:hypothetical protein
MSAEAAAKALRRPVAVSAALVAQDILRLWRESTEAHVTGYAICASAIDDNHLLRCERARKIAKAVGASYNDTLSIIEGAGDWPWIA